MARPIPRRTAAIELWESNPVGTREAWSRELLQFWGLMLSRGRRVKAPTHLATLDHDTGKYRPWTVGELAGVVADRIQAIPGAMITEARRRDIEAWLARSVVVPGERRGRSRELPAAGLRIHHYLGLGAFNRSATRERFWAAFFYSALQTDLEAGPIIGKDLAGSLLDNYLSEGLRIDGPLTGQTSTVQWTINYSAMAVRDPDILLIARALGAPTTTEFPTMSQGLPTDFLASATRTAKGSYQQFLCPGSIIHMRRALTLVLRESGRIGHAAVGDLVETILVNHAAFYFIRGMKVLNRLSAERALPESCARCWSRFQDDLRPDSDGRREDRWRDGDYRAAATAEDVNWVDEHCESRQELFVNAGRKEHNAAKDLARLSLEDLRGQLATYTVNRIMYAICTDVVSAVATSLGEAPPAFPDVLRRLDEWASDDRIRIALSVLWEQKLDILASDADVPGPVLEQLPEIRKAAAGDPRRLEDIARHIVAEAILSARAFTRYVELMNSLLGGGALPSNQDPKGLMARGGSRSTPFHLALNDRALEAFVAILSLEAEELGEPLSFQKFVSKLSTRYGLLVDRLPAGITAPSGVLAEASAQSVEALRGRLHAMGFLVEFSDSAEWNRVSWRLGAGV